MNIPTGDYLIEFLDHLGAVIPGSQATCAQYTEAEHRAKTTAAQLGNVRWRIMKCMANSTDATRERWE
jgi:hypothetical protein